MEISESEKQRLQQIANLIEDGRQTEAKTFLASFIKTNPNCAPAWYLVSFIVWSREEKFRVVRRALLIDPTYQPAQRALQELQAPQANLPTWYTYTEEAPRTRWRSMANLLLYALITITVAVGTVWAILNTSNQSEILLVPTKTKIPGLERIPPTWTPFMTPTPSPIPTRTPLPSPFVLTLTMGRVELSLNSAYGDRIGGGIGAFVVKGQAELTFERDTLQIAVKDEANPVDDWFLQFYAQNFQSNTLYSNATDFGNTRTDRPHIGIRTSMASCNQETSGKFVIEQREPTLIISFSQFCGGVPLNGVLSVRPQGNATPEANQTVRPMYPQSGDGEAEVAFHAASGETMSDGRGDFTVRGISNFSLVPGELILKVEDELTGERWTFYFEAPEYYLGRTYQVNMDRDRNKRITLKIAKYESAPYCQQIIGSFTIEQASDLVISFAYQCDADAHTLLSGTIRFRPLFELTPTPTIAPDQLLSGTPENIQLGQLHLELYSAPNDKIGGGKGNITVDVLGNVRRVSWGWAGTFALDITSRPVNDTWWQFLFTGNLLQVGKTYQIRKHISNQPTHIMGMTIASQQGKCNSPSGQFTIEQQSPAIIISFEQYCDQDPSNVFKGRLTFTPPPTSPTWTPLPEPIIADGTLVSSLQNEYRVPITGTIRVEGQWLRIIKNKESPFLLGGHGTIGADIHDGHLTLSVQSDSKEWRFNFAGTNLIAGTNYDHMRIFDLRDPYTPSMSITSDNVVICPYVDGSFRFERQKSNLLIIFTQICQPDPELSLQGIIQFTPD